MTCGWVNEVSSIFFFVVIFFLLQKFKNTHIDHCHLLIALPHPALLPSLNLETRFKQTHLGRGVHFAEGQERKRNDASFSFAVPKKLQGEALTGSLFLGVSGVWGFQVLSTVELSFSGLFISQMWLPACSVTFREGDPMCLPFLPTAPRVAFSPKLARKERS